MVFVAVMGLLLVGGILLTYDVGRLVTARIRFQNGADGAAVAAVALKASKHHLDTLLRWETFHPELSRATTATSTESSRQPKLGKTVFVKHSSALGRSEPVALG